MAVLYLLLGGSGRRTFLGLLFLGRFLVRRLAFLGPILPLETNRRLGLLRILSRQRIRTCEQFAKMMFSNTAVGFETAGDEMSSS